MAENFRFFESYQYGAEKVKELGKVVAFSQRMHTLINEGSKYHGKPPRFPKKGKCMREKEEVKRS